MKHIPSKSIRNNVYFSNILAQRSNFDGLSLVEWRVFTYLLAQYDSDDWTGPDVTFDILDFCKVYGTKDRYIVEDAIRSLSEREITVKRKDGQTATIRILDDLESREWGGYALRDHVTLRLSYPLRTYYLGNRSKNYTVYKYGYTIWFGCKYTYPLYMWISSFRGLEGKPIKILKQDAYRQFSGGKYSNNFSAFERSVLKPAIFDINAFSEWVVSYRVARKKRVVIGLIFTIKRKPYEECEKFLDSLKSEFEVAKDDFWNDRL